MKAAAAVDAAGKGAEIATLMGEKVKLTMKEQMRRNHRAVKKAVREVEREHKALERNQKKLVTDIKKLAKQGQMNAVKIMAKDLVRNKRFCTKMLEMRSQVSSLRWSGHDTPPLMSFLLMMLLFFSQKKK